MPTGSLTTVPYQECRREWAARRLTVEIVKWTPALAVLEKPSNLGYFFLYRPSEPPSGDQVMERPKDSISEVKFFDVPNTNALGHIFNLKPCVEASGNTVFKSHVYMTRPVPLVTGDDRALEPTEELAILAGQHAVGNFGELGYPHHLRISLGVLGRVQHEIKCLDRTDFPSDCDSFASYHRRPRYICPGTVRWRRIFSIPFAISKRRGQATDSQIGPPRMPGGWAVQAFGPTRRLAMLQPSQTVGLMGARADLSLARSWSL